LLGEKQRASAHADRELRSLRRDYQDMLSEYTVKYDVSTSPRDSFLAERHQRIGQIDREGRELSRLRERVLEIEALTSRLTGGGKRIRTAGPSRKNEPVFPVEREVP
jgi:hypothetical protein